MSLAVLKRKTFTNNPREAPLSGKAGGSIFGFSLNGTTRGNHIGRETNLAPRAMTGLSQKNNNDAYGIYGHSARVCTNDPTVVKTTVMNTRGMLEKKLRGIKRIPPMAPEREQNRCSMGSIITPAPDYVPCERANDMTCVGPLTQNWVKKHIVSNGDQSQYIEKIVKIVGKQSNLKLDCSNIDNNKSFNGIIGALDLDGFNAIQQYNKGCNTSGRLPENVIKSLSSKSIIPFSSSCNKPDLCTGFKPNDGIETFQQTKTINKSGNFSKPGILTVNYSNYISKRLLNKKMIGMRDCNEPKPQPNKYSRCNTPNIINVNITPSNNPRLMSL